MTNKIANEKTRSVQVHFLLFITFSISLFTQCCSSDGSKYNLQAGDLLFQDLDCGELCDAIEAVTHGVNGKDFSHCAMVVQVGDTLVVIEAIGEQVQLTSINHFFKRTGDSSKVENVTIGRLAEGHKHLIKEASLYALKQLGKPYDQVFKLNDGSYYCSELLYESYKMANGGKEVFKLHSMTFKDPNTDDFFPAWVKYYEKLSHEIPEGEPGLNPGSISRSKKIRIIAP